MYKDGINRAEFANMLMESYMFGEAGDWAKDLANQIQEELLTESIRYKNWKNKMFNNKVFKIKKKG